MHALFLDRLTLLLHTWLLHHFFNASTSIDLDTSLLPFIRHQENVLSHDAPQSELVHVLLDLVCSQHIRLGYKDLRRLQGSCHITNQRIYREILLYRRAAHENLDVMVHNPEFSLDKHRSIELLYLAILAPSGFTQDITSLTHHCLVDEESFRMVGRLLADVSDPDDLLGSYVRPLSMILGGFRGFTLGNVLLANGYLIRCIMALLSSPVLVRDKLTGNLILLDDSLGILFNIRIEVLARNIRRFQIYRSIRKAFGQVQDTSSRWNVEVSKEMAVRLWKLERWSLSLERVSSREYCVDEESSKDEDFLGEKLKSSRGSRGSAV